MGLCGLSSTSFTRARETRLSQQEMESVGRIVLLLVALTFLFIAVRGLLGFDLVLPTKFSGLKRFRGRSARVAGGVSLFFALLMLFAIYATTWK